MAEPLSSLIRPHRGPILPALERLAPAPPDNLVAAEIDARTAPGDIIVELHGRGGWVARSAVNRLRRVYDLEASALTRLVAEIVLRPPDLRHLDAALNALAVQPRGNVGLRDAVNGPFTSTCANCGRPVIVEEFIWDGEAPAPSRKSYRCTACRAGEVRLAPVTREDIDRAHETDDTVASAALRRRFPTPDPDHSLPDQLLDLYTPRSLVAIQGIIERIESDLRAQSIQAALRLAVVHILLPSSRLNSYPGRAAALRISSGRVRQVGDRQWRERNPWLLFEEGCRVVRAFAQRLEGAATGHIQARVGTDLGMLLDGTANVVVRQGNAASPSGALRLPLIRHDTPGAIDPRSRIRLVLTQPPIHWTPENLSFAYLATAMALGPEEASSLPLEALFGPPPRTEWAWDAAALRRSLAGVGPVLAADARVVLMLDRTGPGGLVSGVLGGVGAGYRLDRAVLAETGEQISGTLEFAPPHSERPLDHDLPELPPALDPAAPFQLATVEAAVSDVAVAVLQARGEPARFERLLGEVLIGLDRMGHLRRLVGTRTFSETEARADAGAAAVGIFTDAPTGEATSGTAEPAVAAASSEAQTSAIDGAAPPAPETTQMVPAGMPPESSNGSNPDGASAAGSWRDPLRHAREPMAIPIEVPVPAPVEARLTETGPDDAHPSDYSAGDAITDKQPEPPEDPFMSSEPMASWDLTGSGSDPVSLLLEIVMGELRRTDHPRLRELEPGRWWLREPADIAAARAPLSDRLEWAVFSLLSTSGSLTESAFFDRVAGMFRGHDTPDEELVRACLESYRSGELAPDGMLRTDDTLQARYEEHGNLVGMLAEYGHRLGLRCWISRREQRRQFRGAALSEMLSEAEQRVYLPLVAPGAVEALEAVDCIWYLRGKATFLFEVEWTAMLDEAVLRRGPRIESSETLVRFLVIPPERTELVRLKLARSPLLRARMQEDNWHILKADHLRRIHARDQADLESLGPMLGLDPEIEKQGEQLALFG